jgi:hypothetical protein
MRGGQLVRSGGGGPEPAGSGQLGPATTIQLLVGGERTVPVAEGIRRLFIVRE